MTILHIVAASMILAGMALSATSALGVTSYEAGPYLFAAGAVLETAGWIVGIWAGDKRPKE